MATYDKEYLLVKLTPQTIMENIDLLVNELILDKNWLLLLPLASFYDILFDILF